MEKPLPSFHLNKIIKVDTAVFESGRGRIAGLEWGPDNRFLQGKHRGWVYTVREIGADGNEVWQNGLGVHADEDELIKWGNQGM